MSKLDITDFFIYRWRYWIGYSLVAIGLIAALIFVGLYLPGGISKQEMQSVVTSDAISRANLNSIAVINLPYHLLQKASLAIFGVSILSIKLPSIILAFLSVMGLVLLLKQLFKPNVAVLASLIAITTGQFLFIAQDGTPSILYFFWSVLLILLASLISSGPKKFRMLYKVSFCIVAALSLYTPLSIYMLIALVSAIFLHPHLRFIIRQLSKPKIIIAMVAALLLLMPLVITLVKTPSLGLTLLGIPTHWPDFGANFASLGAQYLGFTKPGGTTLMTPFFELGSMLIIALGAYRIIQIRATAKGYTLVLWILILIPVIILNSNSTSITFFPLVLLLASGLNTLLTYWYKLFPRNPYARIGGLLPIVILVAVLIFSGAGRYIEGYRYDPGVVTNFSKDLKLIPTDTKNLVVASDELAFYQVVAKHNKQFSISTSPTSDTFLATREAKQALIGYKIDKIITTSTNHQGDRFYLYKKLTD
jgi:4-amino-4-deoxy-L-arabinose transferase-like glycosyltransferase